MLSSFTGRASYIEFYIELGIEMIAAAMGYFILVLSGTIYIGFFLYMDGMVRDIEIRMTSITIDATNREKIWSIYLEEIDFHVEIIK